MEPAKENAEDRERHGKTAHNGGEINGQSKLTDSDISLIRLLREMGWKQKPIAEIMAVGQDHISRILNNKRWSHI